MIELRALRLSVRATQSEMAYQMAMPLSDYCNLERGRRIDTDELRAATFAAMRIALNQEGSADLRPVELFRAFRELLSHFEPAGRPRTIH